MHFFQILAYCDVNWFDEICCTNFRYDNRDGSHSHWSDDSVLKGRGLFLSKYSPARLTIENVNYADQSMYKCRVDFKMAPTSISSITLQVIGKTLQSSQFFCSILYYLTNIARGCLNKLINDTVWILVPKIQFKRKIRKISTKRIKPERIACLDSAVASVRNILKKSRRI